MPGCCIDGCVNRSEKGFRLFRIPTGTTNNVRRNEWLRLIGKNTLPVRAVICEMHFGHEQFENRREDGRKLLRPYAIPNLLAKRAAETEPGTEKAAKKVKYSEHVQDVDFVSNTEENCATNTVTNHPEVDNTEVDHMDVCHTASNEDKEDKEHIKRLQIALKNKMKECSMLKRKLREKEKREKRFDKIFSQDQIHYVGNETQRGESWSAETITNALKLYVACGQKGYEEIRRQSLPYPSIRTLQHRIQGLKFKPGIFEDIFRILEMKVSSHTKEVHNYPNNTA